MASFTGVGDNTTLLVPQRGEDVAIAISGTYNMTIELQREVGAYGSGAWEPIKQWSTADATVAYTYTTKSWDEHLRLIVLVDTSGTATATLTDASNLDILDYKDAVGNTLLKLTQKGIVLPGSVSRGTSNIVSLTASATITAEDHAGRVLVLNAAAGLTATLPAATGTGDKYTFVVGTTVTSNDDIIQVASASDIMQGAIIMATDTSGITVPTASTSDTITMNGSTKGGVKGGRIVLEDAASGLFIVSGSLVTTGAEATPFSAAVS